MISTWEITCPTYFGPPPTQILSVGLQAALEHNHSVRQQNAATATTTGDDGKTFLSVGSETTAVVADNPASSFQVRLRSQHPSGAAVSTLTNCTAADLDATAAASSGASSTPTSTPLPCVPSSLPLLGPRVGLIQHVDLGPGRRYAEQVGCTARTGRCFSLTLASKMHLRVQQKIPHGGSTRISDMPGRAGSEVEGTGR